MRFVAPARGQIDMAVFQTPPLSAWREFDDVLQSAEWPDVAALNALRRHSSMPRFVAQTRDLQGDGLHYESRIAERGMIATRERNWHDLLNALVWIRYPELKAALNRRQVAEIAVGGTKTRTRAQCALTHFDEAGVIVVLRDRALLRAWDAHDWLDLFWNRRAVWLRGDAIAIVFGHALLEHALRPRQLLVGKALTVIDGSNDESHIVRIIAERIASASLLHDPQELRPLPLSGIPGWTGANESAAFYETAECFRPLRAGRRYPDPIVTTGFRRFCNAHFIDDDFVSRRREIEGI